MNSSSWSSYTIESLLFSRRPERRECAVCWSLLPQIQEMRLE